MHTLASPIVRHDPEPEIIRIVRRAKTVRETAAICGVTEGAVRQWIRDRKLAAIRVRGRVLITEDALKAFLEG